MALKLTRSVGTKAPGEKNWDSGKTMPNSDGFPRPFERPGAGWWGRPLWKSSQIRSRRKSGPHKQVAVLDRICFWLPTPRNCVETVILDAGPRDLLMPFTLSFFKMIFQKLPQVLQK